MNKHHSIFFIITTKLKDLQEIEWYEFHIKVKVVTDFLKLCYTHRN